MLNFILWDTSPVAFSFDRFQVQWYGLALIAGVLVTRQIFRKLNKQDPATEPVLLLALVFAVVCGRVVHSLLYDSELFLTMPWQAFLPFRISPTPYFYPLNHYSAEGAMAGMIAALFILRRSVTSTGFIDLLDRFCIAIVVACACVSLGLFMNGGTPGKPTSSVFGTLNTFPVIQGLTRVKCCVMKSPGSENPLESADVTKDESAPAYGNGLSPLVLYVYYQPGITSQTAREFLDGDVKNYLILSKRYIVEPSDQALRYSIFQQSPNAFAGKILTTGIARYPTYLIEGIFFLGLSLVLFATRRRLDRKGGRAAGLFLFTTWTSFLLTGFLKESASGLNHLLCLPFIVAGIVLFFAPVPGRTGK